MLSIFMEIRNIQTQDLSDVKVFTDQWIGDGYFTQKQLLNIFEYSQFNDKNCSFIALDDEQKIVGVRLTYAPSGLWWREVKSISPHLWSTEPKDVAYFKSLFIADKYQGKGLGRELSMRSMQMIKEMQGKAIICHSWLESPNNSSQKYLEKMNFSTVREWPEFWKEIDYSCTRCGKPCLCTACEMIHYL